MENKEKKKEFENKDNKNTNDKKEKKDKKFLNKKHLHPNEKINKNKKKKNLNKEKRTSLGSIEKLYQKAKNLYFEKSSLYDLDKLDYTKKINKEKKWTYDILQTGTFDDKISSLMLYIKDNPKYKIKYLEMLFRLSNGKNRRKNESIILALKELFLENILQGKKYLSFIKAYGNNPDLKNIKISNEKLIESYYEDRIHNLYLKLINLLEGNIINEPLPKLKKKSMDYLFEMIVKEPECEEIILSDLINKLGDPLTEISNYAIQLLKNLQMKHMKMSLVIFNNVKTFFTSSKNNNAKYNALVYLSQMIIPHGVFGFMEESIKFFFNLFNQFSGNEDSNENINNKKIKDKKKKKQKIKEEEETNEKFLSLIVKRINILFKYVKNNPNQMGKINEIIKEKIKVLFELSYNKSLKLSIEILKLLYGIIQSQDQSFSDRYYKSLYDLISNNSLSLSKHVKEALKLIMISLMYDNNINRISSFLKRLLEMSLASEPSYIICILIIVSQIIRNKNKLWKLVEKNQTNIKKFYDSSKRDPRFANGENSFLNELYLLSAHYHPSVQRMSKFIIDNYNKEEISYNGDPLVDFSLVNFLEKFILKNPKIKKEKKNKKEKKIENDDEELQKFIENAEKEENKLMNENNKNDNNKNLIEEENLSDDDLEFISKFNKVYPTITNSKNYIKKMKKKEKKENMNKEEDIIDQKEKNDELDKYADKIIEDEYKKYDKDIDDDNIEDLGEVEEEEDEEENNFDDDLIEENEINDNDDIKDNDLFADASEYEDDEEILNEKPKKKQKRK